MEKEIKCFICNTIIADGEKIFRASNVDKYDICERCHEGIDRKCSRCGDALVGSEYEMPSEGKAGEWGLLCDDCYEEIYQYFCELCQELCDYDGDCYYVVSQKVINEHDYKFNGTKMKPGIYAPIVQEYDESNCLSMNWHEFADGTLKIIVPIDIKGDWWNECPRICLSCVEKYKAEHENKK